MATNGPAGELRDTRSAPFFYITVTASRLLREHFKAEPQRLATARAIYSALAEVANEHRAAEFRATRRQVAAYAGVSSRTLDAYGRAFVHLGLLEVERRRDGRLNLPTVWRLLEPGGVAQPTALPSAANRTRVAQPTTHAFKKNISQEEEWGDDSDTDRRIAEAER